MTHCGIPLKMVPVEALDVTFIAHVLSSYAGYTLFMTDVKYERLLFPFTVWTRHNNQIKRHPILWQCSYGGLHTSHPEQGY